MLLSPTRCDYPGCVAYREHDHHVTYDPEVIKPLCRLHHEEITIINGQHARKYRRPLSNRQRWWIWYQWRDGKLKARRTRKAQEYIEEWDQNMNLEAERRTRQRQDEFARNIGLSTGAFEEVQDCLEHKSTLVYVRKTLREVYRHRLTNEQWAEAKRWYADHPRE
jgi:hypothetical protein